MLNFKEYLKEQGLMGKILNTGNDIINKGRALKKAALRGSCGGKSCSRKVSGEYSWSDESNLDRGTQKSEVLDLRDKSLRCHFNIEDQSIALEGLAEYINQNVNLQKFNDFIKNNKKEIKIKSINTLKNLLPPPGPDARTGENVGREDLMDLMNSINNSFDLSYKTYKKVGNKIFVYYKFI